VPVFFLRFGEKIGQTVGLSNMLDRESQRRERIMGFELGVDDDVTKPFPRIAASWFWARIVGTGTSSDCSLLSP
jgi:hypothetical protein